MLHQDFSKAWATASRYHEPHVTKCFFECKDHPISNKDNLKHYVYCPTLWEIVQGVTCHTAGPLNGAPITRLTIISHNIKHIYNWALACRVYNGLKNEYLDKNRGSQRCHSYEEILAIASKLARFHWSLIRDRHVR